MPSNPIWLPLVFAVALLSGAVLTWLVRKWVVAQQIGQTVRDDGPQSHLKKMGTPILGGLGMMAALTLVTGLLWVVKGHVGLNPAVPLCLALALAYAAIGFADDWSKVRYKRALGLKARIRVVLEVVLALAFAFALVYFRGVDAGTSGAVMLVAARLASVWPLIVVFVLVGGANAVNLTDGLDGLAGGVSCFCAAALAVACWLLGHNDLALFAAALSGVCAGFLWLNCHPASIFMGDVGSLGLGGALAAIAVAARMELLLGLFGIVFVIEALSVIIQVLYFKASGGKRVFRMAPFHHHLELGGMAETKVVIRFWLITLVAGALGIALVASLAGVRLIG